MPRTKREVYCLRFSIAGWIVGICMLLLDQVGYELWSSEVKVAVPLNLVIVSVTGIVAIILHIISITLADIHRRSTPEKKMGDSCSLGFWLSVTYLVCFLLGFVVF